MLNPKLKICLLAVVLATVSFFTAWAYNWASQRVIEANCAGNMKTIALALENYQSMHKRYPSPDFGGHSWRIRCLPFVLASSMYNQYRFDQRWDSTENITLDMRLLQNKKDDVSMSVHGIPYAYPCKYNLDVHGASYLMIVGDNAFGKPDGWRVSTEIVDGLETTISVAETKRTEIHWLSPKDFVFDQMSLVVNDGPNSISSDHPRGPAVIFCDGAVYRLNPAIDRDTLLAMLTINGGEDLSRRRLVTGGLLVQP